MKTPDETKKGLEFVSDDCRGVDECEKSCAYYKQCCTFVQELAFMPVVQGFAIVPRDMLSDTLAYIQ